MTTYICKLHSAFAPITFPKSYSNSIINCKYHTADTFLLGKLRKNLAILSILIDILINVTLHDQAAAVVKGEIAIVITEHVVVGS